MKYFGFASLSTAILALTTTLLFQVPGYAADRYGGIEIGAKGVKFAAIEVDGNTVRELQVPKEVVNVTIASIKELAFDQWKIDDAATVVRDAKAAMETSLNIPASNIMVVASSGVPSFASNFQTLVDEIKSKSGLDLKKIDAAEEAALTNLALIPAARRGDTMVVDIGSGNTKGGAFERGSNQLKDFTSIDVKFGTTSLDRKIKEVMAASNRPALEIASEIARDEIGGSLQSQVGLKPVLAQRKNVLFSGGSVWAMVTMMKPEAALEPFPSVSASDIAAYKQLIQTSLPGYPKVNFAKIADAKIRAAAQADYDRITNPQNPVFKPDQLFAGAVLLDEVSKALDFQNRNVLFDRKALTAWITAKITPEALRDKLPEALGRVLPTQTGSTAPTSPGATLGATPSVTPAPSSTAANSAAQVPAPSTASATAPAPAASAVIDPVPTPAPAQRAPSVPSDMGGIVQSSPSLVEPGSMPMESSSMQLVEVWANETVYETRTVCCWEGRHRKWRSVHQCVPVTRSVCRLQWQSVAETAAPCCEPSPSVSPTCCETSQSLVPSTTIETTVTAPYASGFRYWNNDKGVTSKIRMKELFVSSGWVVFESEANRLISYPLARLSQFDRNYLSGRDLIARSPKTITDSSGNFKAPLTLISVDHDAALFLKNNGLFIEVPLAQLSASDRRFVVRGEAVPNNYVAIHK